MDEEMLRQTMYDIRAKARTALQHVTTRQGGMSETGVALWSKAFLDIANRADETLAETVVATPQEQRGFGVP